MTINNLSVLEALDIANTQWYHDKAIRLAGLGFFTALHNLFCIFTVTKLLGRLYYPEQVEGQPGNLSIGIHNTIVGVGLVGILLGQLISGWLGDKLGRIKMYSMTLLIMAIGAICSGLSFGYSPKAIIGTLCFFRFWLGFGVGGTYPLSATIASEYANKKERGEFIAVVFAMQGTGILFASLVSMVVSHLFLIANPAPSYYDDNILSAQRNADYAWRIVLMLGALPALLTYYWCIKMPETARYTAIIKGNAKQAALDMGFVLDTEIQPEEEKLAIFNSNNDYPLLSRKFFNRHGRHLFGTMSTWFVLDIAFYGQNLTQKNLYSMMGLNHVARNLNALEEMFENSRAMSVISLLGTYPGYWFTVAFIDKLGRFRIQLMGFFMMSGFMFIIGIKYEDLTTLENRWLFSSLYSLTFFFANFGPNSTTFVLAAELFPTRMRSTCHAISAASGKAGAIVATFGLQKYTMSAEKHKIKTILMMLALINMLGFFCTFLLTETKARSLEEISGEDGNLNKGNEQASIGDSEVDQQSNA